MLSHTTSHLYARRRVHLAALETRHGHHGPAAARTRGRHRLQRDCGGNGRLHPVATFAHLLRKSRKGFFSFFSFQSDFGDTPCRGGGGRGRAAALPFLALVVHANLGPKFGTEGSSVVLPTAHSPKRYQGEASEACAPISDGGNAAGVVMMTVAGGVCVRAAGPHRHAAVAHKTAEGGTRRVRARAWPRDSWSSRGRPRHGDRQRRARGRCGQCMEARTRRGAA